MMPSSMVSYEKTADLELLKEIGDTIITLNSHPGREQLITDYAQSYQRLEHRIKHHRYTPSLYIPLIDS